MTNLRSGFLAMERRTERGSLESPLDGQTGQEAGGIDSPIDVKTVKAWLEALECIWIIGEQPGWGTHLRSNIQAVQDPVNILFAHH